MIRNYSYQDSNVPKTSKINIRLSNLMSSNQTDYNDYSIDYYFSNKSSQPQSSPTLFYDSSLNTNIWDHSDVIHYFVHFSGDAKLDLFSDVSSFQASYQLLSSALIFSVSAFSQVSFGSALTMYNREESYYHNVSIRKAKDSFETEFVSENCNNQSKQNKQMTLLKEPIFMDATGDGKIDLILEYIDGTIEMCVSDDSEVFNCLGLN